MDTQHYIFSFKRLYHYLRQKQTDHIIFQNFIFVLNISSKQDILHANNPILIGPDLVLKFMFLYIFISISCIIEIHFLKTE